MYVTYSGIATFVMMNDNKHVQNSTPHAFLLPVLPRIETNEFSTYLNRVIYKFYWDFFFKLIKILNIFLYRTRINDLRCTFRVLSEEYKMTNANFSTETS